MPSRPLNAFIFLPIYGFQPLPRSAHRAQKCKTLHLRARSNWASEHWPRLVLPTRGNRKTLLGDGYAHAMLRVQKMSSEKYCNLPLHPQIAAAACPICAQPSFLISLVAIVQMNSTQPQSAQALPSTRLRRAPRWTVKRTIFLVLPHCPSVVCPIRRPHAGA